MNETFWTIRIIIIIQIISQTNLVITNQIRSAVSMKIEKCFKGIPSLIAIDRSDRVSLIYSKKLDRNNLYIIFYILN
jgi:hypothetical protein